MKNKLNIPILLTTAIALTSGLSRASDDFASGDLALVVYQLGATPGSAIFSEYYVFNLGPAAGFRENTLSNVDIKTVNSSISSSNISTDLVNIFGANWADSGKVRMMVVSAIPSDAGTLVNGDAPKTVYFSKTRTSLNTGDKGASAVFATRSDSLITQGVGAINSFLYIATNNSISPPSPTVPAASGANVSGVRVTTSWANNLSLYIPPTVSTYFKWFDPAATMNNGQLNGTAGVEAAVDVFRVIHSENLLDENGDPLAVLPYPGIDLTSGSSTGSATANQGQFIGSITLDSSGNLKVQAAGVAPASANYYSFATANSPNLAGGPNADADGDGINNLTEYALNTNLSGSDGSVGTLSGSILSFTKRAAAVANGDLTYSIEISTDLGISNPWAPLGGVTNDSTTISGTLPTGLPKQFARLKILSSAVAP